MSTSRTPPDPILILTIKRFIFLSNNQLVSPQSQTKYLGKFQTKFSRSLELKIYFQKFFRELKKNWTLSISKIIKWNEKFPNQSDDIWKGHVILSSHC